jgi:hypothetical protein
MERMMKKLLLTASLLTFASSFAAPAFARDDGPRFASDLLDTLVAQHADASRYIRDRQAPAKGDAAQAPGATN